MKALLIGGSPRKGNTEGALDALEKGLSNASGMEITRLNAAEMGIEPCVACDVCRQPGHAWRCCKDDGTNEFVQTVLDTDLLVLATPVYWFGITGQLKIVLDKFYANTRGMEASDKKLGLIAVGELGTQDPQYKVIEDQFKCLCNYLGWDFVFYKTYSAKEKGKLLENTQAMEELENLYQEL